MELTYENLLKWFNVYFKDVYQYQGALETVSKLKKYFAPDLELSMYTSPASPPRKIMDRDALLLSFVHPGLLEEIIPRDFVIDVKQMIVAVQFEIIFQDQPTGKTWESIQASAHYHLIVNEEQELKIRRIKYWTEALPKDLFEYWGKYREEALAQHAMRFING